MESKDWVFDVACVAWCRQTTRERLQKNKAKTNPISEKPKMNVNSLITKDCENDTALRPKKTNPNKPNSPPILKISVLNFVKLCKILTTYEISF